MVKHSKTYGRWFHADSYWIVPVDDTRLLKTGDILYANSKDCRAFAVPIDRRDSVPKQ